jgi:cobalt-zinc-cadmium efflux system outer membrane protein
MMAAWEPVGAGGRALGRVALGAWMIVAGAAAAAAQAGAEAPVTLADLERLALARNPTLAHAAAGVEAARGRARQAGLLPNPTIGYSGEEISSGPVIRGGEHGFFVEQVVPLGGKLRLSRRVFEQEAVQAEASADVQRQRVLTSVRMLYYEAIVAERRVQVRERLARLTSEAVAVSAQLYNVGAADRPDTLEAEIEAHKAQLELVNARNVRARVWRELATAVGDPTLAPRPLAGSAEEGLPELSRDEALRRILSESPEIAAARAAVERARLALARARKEPTPDLLLRGGPRYNRELLEVGGRPVGWEAAAEVGVVIPLFNRNQGGIGEATAAVGRAEAELRRLELSLEARLARVFEEYLTALRAVDLYRGDILPRAEEAYMLYLRSYERMAAAYPQVLIAQRNLLQSHDTYLAALEAAWRSSVEIQGLLLSGGLETPPSVEGPEDAIRVAVGGSR